MTAKTLDALESGVTDLVTSGAMGENTVTFRKTADQLRLLANMIAALKHDSIDSSASWLVVGATAGLAVIHFFFGALFLALDSDSVSASGLHLLIRKVRTITELLHGTFWNTPSRSQRRHGQ